MQTPSTMLVVANTAPPTACDWPRMTVVASSCRPSWKTVMKTTPRMAPIGLPTPPTISMPRYQTEANSVKLSIVTNCRNHAVQAPATPANSEPAKKARIL